MHITCMCIFTWGVVYALKSAHVYIFYGPDQMWIWHIASRGSQVYLPGDTGWC
jgi:hypothetical protein